jgi:formiminotetrahydrofolate cyclodeaminase
VSEIDAVLGRILDSQDCEVGGGAAAAVAGCMAAALAAMVARLSLAYDLPLSAQTYEDLAVEADALAAELSQGAADDVAAYARLKAAYGLAKDRDEAVVARKKAIEQGLHHAAVVPLENARRAARAGDICALLRDRSNPAAASDLAVAATLADSAVAGCIWNVEVNTAAMQDRQAAQALLDDLAALCTTARPCSPGSSGGEEA